MRTIRTQKKRGQVLKALGQGLSAAAAAKAAGIGRTALYAWRKDDEAFCEEWDDAVESGTDLLEDLALERAKTSDTMLIFLLNGRRPEKYRKRLDHRVDANVTGGVLVAPTTTDMETWQAQAQQQQQEAKSTSQT